MKNFLRYFHPEHFTKVSHQLIFFTVSFIIFLILLYKPFVEFHPNDKAPALHPINQQVLDAWGKQPVPVKTGMTITDIIKFDTIKSEFTINAIVWFIYDSTTISQETINKFEFSKGEFITKSEPRLSIIEGKTVLAQYTIRLQFGSLFDYVRFPLDDHQIFLYLTNPAVSAQEVIYVADPKDYIVANTITMAGWNIVGNTVSTGYLEIDLGSNKNIDQPFVHFTIDISKQDIRQLALILFPLLFLFFMGLFSFSVPNAEISVTMPIASIGGLFAYSFVIQTLAPSVGYLMLSDSLFLFFLVTTFIIFLVSALSAVSKNIISRRTLNNIEGITILLLYIAFVVYWYYLTHIKYFI